MRLPKSLPTQIITVGELADEFLVVRNSLL